MCGVFVVGSLPLAYTGWCFFIWSGFLFTFVVVVRLCSVPTSLAVSVLCVNRCVFCQVFLTHTLCFLLGVLVLYIVSFNMILCNLLCFYIFMVIFWVLL